MKNVNDWKKKRKRDLQKRSGRRKMKMNKQVKRNLAEWLDDRKNIIESFNNPADEVFYKGAVEALIRAGFDVIVKDEKHTIL